MNIKNKKLLRHPGEKPKSTLPGMYKESKLFTRKHPNADGSQYSKGVEIPPDPYTEPLEPQDENKISKTQKATDLLNTMLSSQPDTSGTLEGKFKVSVEEMVKNLNKILEAEYSQWFRYYHYYLILRGHARNAIAEEFEKHAEEELEHAERIAMRIIGLGEHPTTTIEEPVHLESTEEIIKELIRKEQEGIQLYRQVLDLCGNNEGTRQILEGNVEKEQEHVDDLWRFLKNPELVKANTSAGRSTMPSEKQAKREYSNSFARYPKGISGITTPDLPDRGKDWPGEVDEEKEQEEAQTYFKEPKNLLKQNKSVNKSFSAAMKALAGAPLFVRGSMIPPREIEFLTQHGYSPEEVNSGRIQMTPWLRAEYNKWLSGTVRKSIDAVEIKWRQ